MINEMINLLKRFAYTFVHLFRIAYWVLFRPKTRGVKCIVEHNGEIFFVRLGYAHKSWTIPGGGVGHCESFADAAQRELLEETGVRARNLIKIGEYDSNREFKRDHVEVYYGQVSNKNFSVDGFEILEARWASPFSPPKPHARRVPELMKI